MSLFMIIFATLLCVTEGHYSESTVCKVKNSTSLKVSKMTDTFCRMIKFVNMNIQLRLACLDIRINR